MQPEQQPVSDSNVLTKSHRSDVWPPKVSRLTVAALLAAGLGYIVINTMLPIFIVPEEISTFPEQSPRWMYERLEKTQYKIDGRNYSVAFGIIGAILGASSIVCAFGARAVKAVVIAVVASSVSGVVGANLSNWMFFNMRVTSGGNATIMGISLDGMAQSIIGYALLWGLIGLGVGIGVGSVCGFRKSVVAGISGLCGGTLGAMLYVVLTAQISIGTTMNRVLPYGNLDLAIWLVWFSVAIVVCIALGSGEKRHKETKQTPERVA